MADGIDRRDLNKQNTVYSKSVLYPTEVSRDKKGDSRVDTSVVLGGVGDLGPFTPDDLTAGRHHTQF